MICLAFSTDASVNDVMLGFLLFLVKSSCLELLDDFFSSECSPVSRCSLGVEFALTVPLLDGVWSDVKVPSRFSCGVIRFGEVLGT